MKINKFFKFLLGILILVILGLVLSYVAKRPVSVVPASNIPAGWKIFSDEKTSLSFFYPENLSTEYIHPNEWPPQIELVDTPFACAESSSEMGAYAQTEKKIIGDKTYCISTLSEGAAGSIYTEYAYAFPITANEKAQTVTLRFTLRAIQCDNYDDPQKTACKQERDTFDLNSLISKIADTVK